MSSTDFQAVQRVLVDLDFPASKEQIVRHAEGRGDAGALKLLRALPLATYQNMSEIRSSVPLDPTVDDGLSPADQAARARSGHTHRIAEHLREPNAE
ncbi:DUF2795 domain-containing protein [Rhizomonospora bruguierae]|uniref:DUF2795 domain-containing protein n=1 Tax=Rhizomonospora bruguierae TaxID=1581705 RepID=UPI001BD06685|nr:DUF2795 domain-containing protein [Micromonospora sp. NBRC 107566]